MRFLANQPGQVVVRVSGPQAAGKSVFVREACEYLQTQDISYHYEEEGETWESFDPKRSPALHYGKLDRLPDARRGSRPERFRDEADFKASRTNAKYLFVVEAPK